MEKTSTPRFISHEEFQKKCDSETSYLQYYGLISSLNQLRKKINSNQNYRQTENKTLVNNVFAGLASAKTFYKTFIEQLRTKPITSQTKWENEYELDSLEKINWKKIYSKSFKCSKSSKLRNFQLKLLHRRIPTNVFWGEKIGIKDTNSCTFCGKEIETLLHLFWTCDKTQNFRISFETWLHSESILSKTKAINKLDALGLNTDPENLLLGFCKLVVRH